MTVMGGEVVWDLNARDAVPWEESSAEKNIRQGEFLIPPDEKGV